MSQSPNNLTADFVGNLAPLQKSARDAHAVMQAVNSKLLAADEAMSGKLAASSQRVADMRAQAMQTQLLAAGKTDEAEIHAAEHKFESMIAGAKTAEERTAAINLRAVSLKATRDAQATRAYQIELDKQAEADKRAAGKREAGFADSFKGLEKIGKVASLVSAGIMAVNVAGKFGKLAFGGGNTDTMDKAAEDYIAAKDAAQSYAAAIPIVGAAVAKVQGVLISFGESVLGGSPADELEKMQKKMDAFTAAQNAAHDSAKQLRDTYREIGDSITASQAKIKELGAVPGARAMIAAQTEYDAEVKRINDDREKRREETTQQTKPETAGLAAAAKMQAELDAKRQDLADVTSERPNFSQSWKQKTIGGDVGVQKLRDEIAALETDPAILAGRQINATIAERNSKLQEQFDTEAEAARAAASAKLKEANRLSDKEEQYLARDNADALEKIKLVHRHKSNFG